MSHYLWQLRPYFRQVAGQLVLGSLNGIVMNTAVVLPSVLLGRALDTALAFERGEVDSTAVAWAALAFVGGTLLTEGPRVLKRWWLMTANARIRANLRADAVRGVLGWPMERLQQTPIGELMARIIGDVEVLGVGVREFSIEIWDTVLFSISFIVAMLFFDAGLTVLVLLPVPLAMLLAHATGRWVGSRTTRAREANASLTAALQEQLAGIRVIKLFGRAAAAIERLRQLSQRQAETNRATLQLRGGLQPVYTSLMAAGVVLLVWRGGDLVVSGVWTVGAFVAYLDLFTKFVNRGFRVPQLVNSIQSGGAAYVRLRPLLAPALSVRGEPTLASFRPGRVLGLGRAVVQPSYERGGSVAVALEGVTFSYPGRGGPTLRDLSFDLPAGALVGITGPVGCGKSTLAQLLVGLYGPDSGRICFDGRSLTELPPGERAARTGYLPQDGYLFSGSVRENVLLFDHRSESSDDCTFDNAASRAALVDDLRDLPAGDATEIGELGVRVSGGQRQRIGLARALAATAPRTPGLLVLDDPFSAVDVDTEAKIVASLGEAYGPAASPDRQATIVLCSHRLAAFPRADLVIVLDGGRIVEQGSHERLVAADGLYARIYRAQLVIDADRQAELAR